MEEANFQAEFGWTVANIQPLIAESSTKGALTSSDEENSMKQVAKYIRWFEEIRIEDVPLVGGKNASLGEMYRELTNKGIKIPNGFAITAEAYWLGFSSAGHLR